jgi:hypothetical protein
MSASPESRNKATLTCFQGALTSGDWELISKATDEVGAPDALIAGTQQGEYMGLACTLWTWQRNLPST